MGSMNLGDSEVKRGRLVFWFLMMLGLLLVCTSVGHVGESDTSYTCLGEVFKHGDPIVRLSPLFFFKKMFQSFCLFLLRFGYGS